MNFKHLPRITFFLLFSFGVLWFASPTFAQTTKETQAQKNTAQLQKALSLFPGERDALTDFRLYVSTFYRFSISAAILVAVMMMMIGGVIWLTSAGNQGRVSKAQEYIINSIIGVLLLLGSYSIIQAINPRLVQLDDPNLPKIPAFGSCLSTEKPKSPAIVNATHTCELITKADCKEPKKFDAKKSCEDLCTKYSSADGSCYILDKDNFAKKALDTSSASCRERKILIVRATRAERLNVATRDCRNYCETDLPEGVKRCASRIQQDTFVSDSSGAVHNVACTCVTS